MRVPTSPQAVAGLALAWLDDARAMIGFLTRLPAGPAPPPSARSLRAAPLAGALAGAVGGLTLALALWLGLPATPAAVAAFAAMVLVTGALHEDGLADVADGFGGGGTAEAKLEIMRDSRIGAYGALALALAVLARVSLIAALAVSAGPLSALLALVAVGALSRTAIVVVMASLGPARADGLAHAIGTPDRATALQAGIVAIAVTVLAIVPTLGLVASGGALAVTVLAALAVTALARRHIGGHTGDVCGAAQQTGEIAVLAVLVMSTG